MPADLPRDFVTCTFHFNVGATGLSDSAFQALAASVGAQWFSTSGAWTHYGDMDGVVNAYNLADPTPRPERGHFAYTAGSHISTLNMPRQIALRVSVYGMRNLKRLRGGVYLPYNSGWSVADRPSLTVRTNAVALIKQIATASTALTPSWGLCTYSKVNADITPVQNIWCNDVWDTQRRRAPKETTRTTGTFP